MSRIETLIAAWEERRKDIINPDNITSWKDLGIDEPPDYPIEDYMEMEAEFDEGDQVKITLISEFLNDLRLIHSDEGN